MLISIPILATEQKQANNPAPVFFVRPLFNLSVGEQANSFQRAANKLTQTVRKRFGESGKKPRHHDLAWFTFSPLLSTKFLQFRLFLAAQSFDCKYLFVVFDAFGKKLAFTPNVPGIWFEIERGEDLQTRAVEVLTEHFRDLERQNGKGTQKPDGFNFTSKSFVTTLEFNLEIPQKYEAAQTNPFALLGGESNLSGADELRRVGRNLDELFPDDLERAAGRESQLEELTGLLDSKTKRPVIIVGKNQVGKTNLLNEYVFQKLSRDKNKNSGGNQAWLISPQRLISGMSYVGQWENRLIAILKEAKKQNHLLYFDDLLGLFFAGVSANSDLNVAQVLKPYVERRDIRIVGEIAPETFRVLKEKDRGFAEAFHVFRLEETGDEKTLKIALAVRRETEFKYGCRFALDAVPAVLDLQRRYNREAAFPGKAASFLKQIANKFQGEKISRENVLKEFEAKSGLKIAFLDDHQKLKKPEIIEKISENLIGQKTAIEAAADVISIAKARLNDASRPLASFLFLGATGVGKTEAAKQIAAYLYGAEEKLLRFDMNELVSPFDVARLVGTFDQPEGILTSAIRREPFSVVLLDEIEKADADVFNLLLQVLGEGRLTDAFGRTADFSNAIIILTSNLGTKEANAKLGFRETNESNASIYRQAAEKFFRPEFFNRLDKIIPFENLRREEVGRIARLLLQKVFAREGFVRRRARIEIEPSALEKIIDEGYNPQLGARALKRAIEKNLVQPVAVRLSAIDTNAPAIIKISREGKNFLTEVGEIKPLAFDKASVRRAGEFADTDAELDRIEDVLDRIEGEIETLNPRGEIDPKNDGQAKFFLVREYVKRIERMIERAEKWNDKKAKEKGRKIKNETRRLVSLDAAEIDFTNFLSGSNLSNKLKNLAAENRDFGETIEDYLRDIWRETSLLQTVSENAVKPLEASSVMIFRCADVYFGREKIPDFAENYRKFFSQELGLKAEFLEAGKSANDYFEIFLKIEGNFGFDLAETEIGNHVFVNRRGDFTPLEIEAAELETNGKIFDFQQKPADKKTGKDFPVVRLYNERGIALDFRSALMTKENMTFRELRAFILSGLEMPKEFNLKD